MLDLFDALVLMWRRQVIKATLCHFDKSQSSFWTEYHYPPFYSGKGRSPVEKRDFLWKGGGSIQFPLPFKNEKKKNINVLLAVPTILRWGDGGTNICICRIKINLWKKGNKLDHDDQSKPSNCLTNGPEPSKTIESDGRKIKNHRKTIDGNGQTAKKHSMVMVSSKTIGNLQWSLQNHWNLQLLQE